MASELGTVLDNYAALGACHTFLGSAEQLQQHVQPKLEYLFTARPTAVNLGVATKRLTKLLERGVAEQITGMELAQLVVDEGRLIADEDIGRNSLMRKHGGEWLLQQSPEGEEKLNVMTVCNTGSLATSGKSSSGAVVLPLRPSAGHGTALGLITYLHDVGHLGTAFYTQSTPYHQVRTSPCALVSAYPYTSIGLSFNFIGASGCGRPIDDDM